MAIYKSLEITQNDFGGVEVLLDGEPVKGCKSATLELDTDSIPVVTLKIMAKDVKVELPEHTLDGQIVFKVCR